MSLKREFHWLILQEKYGLLVPYSDTRLSKDVCDCPVFHYINISSFLCLPIFSRAARKNQSSQAFVNVKYSHRGILESDEKIGKTGKNIAAECSITSWNKFKSTTKTNLEKNNNQDFSKEYAKKASFFSRGIYFLNTLRNQCYIRTYFSTL